MSVKLRLVRMGKTKQPTYRVVATDARSPRQGRFIDWLGTYEPRKEPSGIRIDAEKAQHWISNGAQPTERVQKLLEVSGVLTGDQAAKTLAAKKLVKRQAVKKKTADKQAGSAPVSGDGATADSAGDSTEVGADADAVESGGAVKAADES